MPVSAAQAQILREVWYDPEDGFGSQAATLKQARERDPSITPAEVKEWFEDQESNQRKRGKGFNSYVTDFPRQQWQVDLADFSGEDPLKMERLETFTAHLEALLKELRKRKPPTMDLGAAGTFRKARAGFSDALKAARGVTLKKLLGAYEQFTVVGDTEKGGKTALKLGEPGRLKPRKGTKIMFRYGLCVVDVFSKKAAVEPVGNKDPETLRDAYKKCQEVLGPEPPKSVYTDDDGGFTGVFPQYLKSQFTTHVVTRAHAPFAERLIRTLKRMLFLREENTGRVWHDLLPTVLAKYNRTEHSATGMTPNAAHDTANADAVHAKISGRAKKNRVYPPIEVGDHVKVLQKAGKMTQKKEHYKEWGARKRVTGIETGVSGFQGTKFYKIEGSERGYLRHELRKVT